MVKILHFADAHIDMANYGRHDPETGLPVRVMDFLKSLDTIVDAAIAEKVELVIFAGDAYKDRSPAPTFQREWGRRIMRLSRAGIPTLLLVGNHDLSPALGRAHALDSFDTLEVDNVTVLDKPVLLTPDDLGGVPIQVIAMPWISRSSMMAHLEIRESDPKKIYEQLEYKISELITSWLDEVDPDLPVILTAHASVQGAVYGGERLVMLGTDLVLPGSLVKNTKLDYVALGHIHKPQNLNKNSHPPVIYPGSIERVDFGEAKDDKFFIIAEVEKGNTEFEWCKLEGIRTFIDRSITLKSQENVTDQLRDTLQPEDQLTGAIVRLTVDYPREWEAMIDDAALREFTAGAFEFHLVKRPQMTTRIRLPEDEKISEKTAVELLEIYWRANHYEKEKIKSLKGLAGELLHEGDEGEAF